MPLTTTLAAIRSHSLCKSGWEKLLASKGLDYSTDRPFSLADVLASNGVEDTIWCLRAIQEDKEVIGRIAKEFADSVAHLRNRHATYAAAAKAATYAAAAKAATYAAAAKAAAAVYAVYANQAERKKQAVILAKYF